MQPDLSYIAEPLRALAVPVSTLTPDPANVRRHDETNLAAIEASLRRWGQRLPLVVQRDGMVVRAGNGRLEIARKLGWSHVAVVVVDEAEVEATAFAIADNRTAELATWNDAALADLLNGLPGEIMLATGFTNKDLQHLLFDTSPEQTHEGEIPDAPEVAVTKPGDIWVLGEHRLMCGDSTKIEDVQRLMDGNRAAICATDPPYLVDYTGERPDKKGGQKGGKDWSETYREVEIKDADGFFRAVFTNVLQVISEHSAIYCWYAHKRHATIIKIWGDLKILDHQQVIWVKPTAVFGRVFWHFRHEPCLMGWVQGSMPAYDTDHSHNSVWEVNWEGKNRVVGNEHPTQKPVELFARPIRKHTKPGDLCFEPFSGSGSQLVACEQIGRRCFAMELEPRFVDVGLRRWQTLAAKNATLLGDGRTFEEIDAARTAKPIPSGPPEPIAGKRGRGRPKGSKTKANDAPKAAC